MMKNLVIFAVLGLLVVYTSGAVLEPEAVVKPATVVDAVEASALSEGVQATSTVSRNLNIGHINVGDKLLYRNYFSKAPMANAVQSQDIKYSGKKKTKISAVVVSEVGYTQYATSYVTAGGLNTYKVTVRLTSARGYGYSFSVEIYGK